MQKSLRNIKNNFASFQQLISIYDDTKDLFFDNIEVVLNHWFAANMSAALGGILDRVAAEFNEISIICPNPDIERILLKNDFLSYYGHERIEDTHHTTIRFQKLKPTDGKFFNSYIVNELLARSELPKMSDAVKDKMAETIYEIFVNAQIHSNTDYIYTCGQFFPKDNKIEFTIVDMGIGFKEKVNQRFDSNLSSVQAIRWAVQDRNTTKESVPGGIGLALLKEFVSKNNGKMQIVSDDGFYEIGRSNEQTGIFNGRFPGTIVNLQFRTDDISSYSLREEVTDIF